MKEFKLHTCHKKLLSDTYTPTGVYLRLRDIFPESILLESSDYHSRDNNLSYICCKPIASAKLEKDILLQTFPDGTVERSVIEEGMDLPTMLQDFSNCLNCDNPLEKHSTAALFGYTAYDAVRYFEDIDINPTAEAVPDMVYQLYQYVIVFDHFRNELHLVEHVVEGADASLNRLEALLQNRTYTSFNFDTTGNEISNMADDDYTAMVSEGIRHCQRGDVFQVVFSRAYKQKFKGDDFNVYRALRSVNPSPYLFYFDYGNFKLFGSSPETQLVINKGKAIVHPIAGTVKRTGDDEADVALALQLQQDAKENAEHVMLVDLARNDLSRTCKEVKTEVFKEVQPYSHVIHLVSKVTGEAKSATAPMQVMGQTFPAGTLSGAPKHRAMQLIQQYEKSNRGFYGGCIGILGLNGDFNHAIMIRSFMSKDNYLHYQAGAGIVISSKEENELQEVKNKLMALKKAIELAKEI